MVRDARTAALSATRQMICLDQFNALVSALIDCGAVPREVMSARLSSLAERWRLQARGEIDSEFALHAQELMAHVHSTMHSAEKLSGLHG